MARGRAKGDQRGLLLTADELRGISANTEFAYDAARAEVRE
jgi:hypothetical protein